MSRYRACARLEKAFEEHDVSLFSEDRSEMGFPPYRSSLRRAAHANRTMKAGGARRRLVPAGALQERFPPGAAVHIPVDGGIEAVFEIVERFPV
jgi:hypothetical protein